VLRSWITVTQRRPTGGGRGLDLARTLPPKVQQMIGFLSFHNSSNRGGSLWQHNYEELADHLDLR
jgi:hypothetical protein